MYGKEIWGIFHLLPHEVPAFHNSSICTRYLSLNFKTDAGPQAPAQYLILGLFAQEPSKY